MCENAGPMNTNILAVIAAVILMGGAFLLSDNNHITGDTALAAEFDRLSSAGNSTCSAVFADSIMTMQSGAQIQGSCCSPMSFHRYDEQIEGLKKYKEILEIPPDPYSVNVGLAKEMIAYY